MTKRRTTTVGVFSAHITTGWARSTIVIDDSRNDQPKRVVIEIDRPSDVQYLREQLDKIEASWRASLDSIAVKS